MNLIHAIYKFELLKTKVLDKYSISPILKASKENYNNVYLNELFTLKDKTAKFRKYNPPDILDDYIAYGLRYGNHQCKNQLMVFDTTSYLHPYGRVNIADCDDCLLFREATPEIFEIYVSEGNAILSAQILTMLLDGSLEGEINRLLNKLN